MGKMQRNKGARVENELVHAHIDDGIPCQRVPLSGAAGGSFGGDLVIAGRFRAEVKARASGEGFTTLERWLGENDVLLLKRNRAAPLVVLPWNVYTKLMRHYTSFPREGGRMKPMCQKSPAARALVDFKTDHAELLKQFGVNDG